MGKPVKIRIVEKAWQARIAARWLHSKRVALVLGGTIYLWGVCRQCFLEDEAWIKHELAHIEQFKRYGRLRFAGLYLLESIKKGYYNNRFEAEARQMETAPADLSAVEFV
ncbi:DUF4157 domain-containing protein [Foetidibacter luteolus]|uniref:DUF4157 domain-containing protein n=1 Tax=Foetidibacter luteolus TaxID=2608880 RepID=UPI00129B43EE|nr:DUF4157 domain-containing protein [Foetidibacter luteolus]